MMVVTVEERGQGGTLTNTPPPRRLLPTLIIETRQHVASYVSPVGPLRQTPWPSDYDSKPLDGLWSLAHQLTVVRKCKPLSDVNRESESPR